MRDAASHLGGCRDLTFNPGALRTTPATEGDAPPCPAAELVFPETGEMGRLCRAMDWAAMPLGPVEEWPQSLRTAAGMVIGHAFPSIVLWGPELIQIYNDGYIPVHGTVESTPGEGSTFTLRLPLASQP